MKIESPISAENIEIDSIFKSVFKKSNEIKFRFLSIKIFIVDDVIDINKYPIMSAYVPRYLGKKKMHKMRSVDEIA